MQFLSKKQQIAAIRHLLYIAMVEEHIASFRTFDSSVAAIIGKTDHIA